MAEVNLQVNDRVILMGKLVGTIRFIGETKFAEGEWLGVELDEEKGKNNGSVQDIPYFVCPPNRGMFVRRSSAEPAPAAGGKRTSKMGKKTSILGTSNARRKSSDKSEDPSSPGGNSDVSSPGNSPGGPDQELRANGNPWKKRDSIGWGDASINIDAQQELLETVRNCSGEVAKLEELVKSLSFTLDDAAIRETICGAPAALFSGDDMPDLTSMELEPLLESANARLEERMEAKLSRDLEEHLAQILAQNMEEVEEDV